MSRLSTYLGRHCIDRPIVLLLFLVTPRLLLGKVKRATLRTLEDSATVERGWCWLAGWLARRLAAIMAP